MTLNVDDVTTQLISHSLSLGVFENVNNHEPKSAPGLGLSASLWVQRVRPVPELSGLTKTTARLEMNERIYTNMISEPQDAIDPNILKATDLLMNAFSGDFTLGGEVMEVDLLGAHGTPLSAEAGYIEIDRKVYRVMTLSIPLIIDNAWTQAV